MAVRVERIGAEEWPVLRRLRLAALADSPEAFGQRLEDAAAQHDDEWAATARSSSAGDRRAWFVAWNGRREVGLVQARRRPPDDCLVFSMWVEPSARRSGVGRALLHAVDEWAAGWGARRVVLWVIAGNEAAQRFYERVGFRPLERGADAESGASYGALAMSRSVNRRSITGEEVG